MSTMSEVTIEALRSAAYLRPVDVQLANRLGALANEPDARVCLALALTLRHVADGHVCLPLAELVRRPPLRLVTSSSAPNATPSQTEALVGLTWPELGTWLEAIMASPLVGPGEGPLVVADGHLYLRRYAEHEDALACALARRLRPWSKGEAGAAQHGGDDEETRLLMNRLFTQQRANEPDLQRAAAEKALAGRLTVITGGPGTGKTYTVVNVLALLVSERLRAQLPPPRITLVAPTGKAAARLGESIQAGKARLRNNAVGEEVLQHIPEAPSTIHRALGVMGGSLQNLRHTAENPLATDVLLVDEASMVDLSLMRRLVDACPADARLILLGDKDQLASVEAGAVLGQLAEAKSAQLKACVAQLHTSHRFRDVPGIEDLAWAVNAGDSTAALAVLEDATRPEVTLHVLPKQGLGEAWVAQLLGARGLGAYLTCIAQGEPDVATLERHFANFRILCPLRRGPEGLQAVTLLVEEALRKDGRVKPEGDAYAGRPVLISTNDYGVTLFNGDTGLVLPDPRGESGPLATFSSGDGQTIRRFALSRLPDHETAFAMTVHKAQGSEMEHVAIVLPREASPVLTRELLYTAITRAKQSVTLFAERATVAAAIVNKATRHGRLAPRIESHLAEGLR